MKKIILNSLLVMILLFFIFNILVIFNLINFTTDYSSRIYSLVIIVFTILNLIYFKLKEKEEKKEEDRHQ
ncbi:hypothetical protein [Mammaliicoccus stepanovicii]|uniref:Uncharacterized protein n=1 Tax=Mammaliicoccus stepanovicii TaxID=643214 RepID=A0A239YDR6_9STAP|nr:hypothetical protein [Mammaliicoccus stepanovicii]PNZ75554.1 hypothetical protein CD111_07705 [Mammaliicoccus stepanovicii]GGI42657.1 hypothetical protein GCM10010896_19510 [Mammaliicoccus stepanovicii]SNV56850.1 Uncharacterised protein [Mammaliicoccus stepanovicii]